MEQMTDLKQENLSKGAEPVNRDQIVDLIQTNMFGKVAYGCCRGDPLTNRGKRLQLIKILCLTVIPILGVWGFTMHSLTVSVDTKRDIETGKRLQLIKILCLTVIPILCVWGFTMHSLTVSVDTKRDIETAKTSMSVVVMLGQLIHNIQRERDMSVLYLSDLGPGTKTFLLTEYMATDDALQKLTIWPVGLQSNPREEFRSKTNLMSFITQHRASLNPQTTNILEEINFYSSSNPREEFRSKTNLMSFITQHRASLNPQTTNILEEINFYSSVTSEFLEWLVENIKGSGFGSIWKTLVAYQKITRCKEDIGVERAYGAMFYTTGHFENWIDYEFYNEKIHDFKYNYKTAVFYSDAVVPLHTEEVKQIKSTGLNITEIIFAYRDEIQNHELNVSYVSLEKAKWFFDNITIYLDSLLQIQLKVAGSISSEVEDVLSDVMIKTAVYALMVVVVIAMCPVIMFAANGLSTDIQLYTLTLVEKTKELNLEKFKTETLLYQMVPKSVADRLKNSTHMEPEFFKSVTIFFSDITGFSRTTSTVAPIDLVRMLNYLYTAMDDIIDNYDVYKVETINDTYMVASGLPTRNGDKHVTEICSLALDIQNMMRTKSVLNTTKTKLQLRIGINTGSCMAGIVGTVMLRYCLFGDTINTASRIKTYGKANRIQIAETTFNGLQKAGGFRTKLRGVITVKGKGQLKTFWLLNRWEEFGSYGEDRQEEACLPGELINYSAFSTTRNNAATDTAQAGNVWKEEEVFFKGSKNYSPHRQIYDDGED